MPARPRPQVPLSDNDDDDYFAAAAVVEYIWCEKAKRPVLRPVGIKAKAYARVWVN